MFQLARRISLRNQRDRNVRAGRPAKSIFRQHSVLCSQSSRPNGIKLPKWAMSAVRAVKNDQWRSSFSRALCLGTALMLGANSCSSSFSQEACPNAVVGNRTPLEYRNLIRTCRDNEIGLRMIRASAFHSRDIQSQLDALSALEAAGVALPSDLEEMGHLHSERGSWDAAIALFGRVLEHSDEPFVRLKLAVALQNSGQLEGALKEYAALEQSLKGIEAIGSSSEPSFSITYDLNYAIKDEVSIRYSELLIDIDRLADAERLLMSLVEQSLVRGEVYYLLALIIEKRGGCEKDAKRVAELLMEAGKYGYEILSPHQHRVCGTAVPVKG